MTPALARVFAAYNRTFNQQLFEQLDGVLDRARKTDRGAFFRSVHGTLNHLLWADLVWLARFEQLPVPSGSYDTELEEEFERLWTARKELDHRIEKWAFELTDEILAAQFAWVSVSGSPQSQPLWFAVAHFFNHQTHHRGQLTTLMHQMNCTVGPTDLPLLVRSVP